jgi:hypothetical protein
VRCSEHFSVRCSEHLLLSVHSTLYRVFEAANDFLDVHLSELILDLFSVVYFITHHEMHTS